MNCNSGGFLATARFFEGPRTKVTDRSVAGEAGLPLLGECEWRIQAPEGAHTSGL
jgi:hypothetical protein